MAQAGCGVIESSHGMPKGKPGRAGKAVEMICELYRIEREVDALAAEGETSDVYIPTG